MNNQRIKIKTSNAIDSTETRPYKYESRCVGGKMNERHLGLICVVIFLQCSATQCYQYHYMSRFPGSQSSSNAVRLQLQNSHYSGMVLTLANGEYPRQGKYFVTILPPLPHRRPNGLVGSVQFFNLRKTQQGECLDKLTIRVWNGYGFDTIYHEECLPETLEVFNTKPNNPKMGIQIELEIGENDGVNVGKGYGFEFTFTSYSEKWGLFVEQTCEPARYDCVDFCIYANFHCDRRVNCKNSRDENNCDPDSNGLRFIIFLAALMIATAIMMTACRKITCKKLRCSSVSSEPSTTTVNIAERQRLAEPAVLSLRTQIPMERPRPNYNYQDPPPPYKEIESPPPPYPGIVDNSSTEPIQLHISISLPNRTP